MRIYFIISFCKLDRNTVLYRKDYVSIYTSYIRLIYSGNGNNVARSMEFTHLKINCERIQRNFVSVITSHIAIKTAYATRVTVWVSSVVVAVIQYRNANSVGDGSGIRESVQCAVSGLQYQNHKPFHASSPAISAPMTRRFHAQWSVAVCCYC